jgi:hypothetical protein
MERTIELSVKADGGRIEVFLGGRFLGMVQDKRYPAGVFGMVLAGSGEARFYEFCVEPVLSGAGLKSPH